MSLGLKDALPVARRSAAVGHWHVTLVCVTRYCSKMNGREKSTVHSVLRYFIAGRSRTSDVRCHSGGAASARRHVALCCDQLLISLEYMPTVRTAASRGTLLMASATSLTRQYTGGRLIHGSWILNIFLTPKWEGRLICGSTCTRVHTVLTIW